MVWISWVSEGLPKLLCWLAFLWSASLIWLQIHCLKHRLFNRGWAPETNPKGTRMVWSANLIRTNIPSDKRQRESVHMKEIKKHCCLSWQWMMCAMESIPMYVLLPPEQNFSAYWAVNMPSACPHSCNPLRLFCLIKIRAMSFPCCRRLECEIRLRDWRRIPWWGFDTEICFKTLWRIAWRVLLNILFGVVIGDWDLR